MQLARSFRRNLQIFVLALPSLILPDSNAIAGSDAVPAPSYASGYSEKLPCVNRIGRCFDVTIGGKSVSVIADKSQFMSLNAEIKALNSNVRDVYWTVNEAVDGNLALDVIAKVNSRGLAHLGTEKDDPDVTVYELDDQGLESESELVSNSSVRINGQAVITQQEILTQDFLPPGRYVFSIKYLGKLNWDRKWVFLTVN
jgi:hypothetical protein